MLDQEIAAPLDPAAVDDRSFGLQGRGRRTHRAYAGASSERTPVASSERTRNRTHDGRSITMVEGRALGTQTRRPAWADRRAHLSELHAAALSAADPAAAVARTLRLEGDRLRVGGKSLALDPAARVVLIALGKASPGMARAALEALGPRISSGLIVHPHGAAEAMRWPGGVEGIAAGHPLPDAASLRAGDAALELVRACGERDLVLVLVSGGGSALFEALRPGLVLEEARAVTEALQHAGGEIVELNVVRRALSLVKGGGLARAAAPARIVTLVLSDVVGDHLDAIASGPTIESPTGPRDALAVLARRDLRERFPHVVRVLESAASSERERAAVARGVVEIVGSSRVAGEAVCRAAEELGFRSCLLTDRMQGEAREVGLLVGGLARGMREAGLPLPPPACLVLGGETTVTVRGSGRGGRNLELALGAAQALEGCPGVAVLCVATDGLDGSSGAAGAVVTGETLARARASGLSVHRALSENDSASFFLALGDLWTTGASGTNVNDVAILLAYPPET
jgi:hydroxypyruvate reductase